MTEAFKQQIEEEARQAVTELLAQAKLRRGDVFVVGCSSSEIVGGHIGKDSSLEAAQAVYAGIAPVLAQQGIWLAAQCCEHLNRAIIIEREAAEKYGLGYNLVAGANIAGFEKVAEAMMAQGIY